MTRWLIPLLLTLTVASTGTADSRQPELSGLTRIVPKVLFSVGKDEARRIGLDEGTIQGVLDVKLRQAGVRTVQGVEAAKLPEEARWYLPQLTLDVRVYRVESEPRFYLWGVQLYLHDDVRLTRNSRTRLMAQTWISRGVYGTLRAEPAEAQEAARTEINASIRDQLDEFTRAYLGANSTR
ncbi:MAG TPA: hypothetical protein VFO18_06350 [Methylomirabilota bacterium]|nr:hypothetical protein [Methylomirabilota bacterium]